jgi:hypothetical protein
MPTLRRLATIALILVATLLSSACLPLELDDLPPVVIGPSASLPPAPSSDSLPPAVPTGLALAAVPHLAVKGRAPKTGYDRALFGQAWLDTDHNGCDTRNDVLRRDLADDAIKAGTRGCVLLSGTLDDPYTGVVIDFVRGEGTSSLVQIDHVVALSDAWQKGAQQWSEPVRESFANDSLNLLAVDGPTNQSKGDGDAATWLPIKPYRCAYAARIVAVKVAYGLWVTSAERDALAGILLTCPAEPLPQREVFVLGAAS